MIVRTGNTICRHGAECPHSLGPASPAPLRGFSHHGSSVTGGSFLRPLPGTAKPVAPHPLPAVAQSEEVRAYEARLSQMRLAARRYRARKREEAHRRWAAGGAV